MSVAICGREAWATLENFYKMAQEQKRSLNDFINLVSSDSEMPEMDGNTLTRRIRDHKFFKALPCILFSSLISELERFKGVKAGVDVQVAKLNLPMLTAKARHLIDKDKNM